MSISIVRLGTPRGKQEGLRIGTVRRPPRGVRKDRYAIENWYDAWLPELSPSDQLFKRARNAKTDAEWAAFVRGFEREMVQSSPSHVLDLLALFSHHTNLSIGCYCENERRCHRSVLRQLLEERGAKLGS